MPPKGLEYYVTTFTFYRRELGMGVAFSFRLLITPCGLVWPVMSRSLAVTVSQSSWLLLQATPLPNPTCSFSCHSTRRTGMAALTGWMVRGSNPGRSDFFGTCPDRHCGPNILLYIGYGVIHGVKAAWAWCCASLSRGEVEERACYRVKFTRAS
jgi:hypothetical protein